jgi:hypothetical protein
MLRGLLGLDLDLREQAVGAGERARNAGKSALVRFFGIGAHTFAPPDPETEEGEMGQGETKGEEGQSEHERPGMPMPMPMTTPAAGGGGGLPNGGGLSACENLFSSSTVVSLGPCDGVAYACAPTLMPGDGVTMPPARHAPMPPAPLVVAYGGPAALIKEFIQ